MSEARLQEYKNWLKHVQGLSDVTISTYVSIARTLELTMSKLGKDRIDREVIIRALEQYDNPVTKGQLSVSFRKYLTFLGEEALAKELRLPQPRKELEWWWSVDEVKRIFAACETDRELVIVSFAYLQAMRRVEISKVRVSDLDLEQAIVRVRAAKKRGVQFIIKELYRGGEWYPDQVELLKRYIKENNFTGEDRIVPFTTVYLNYIFRRIVKRAGVRPAGLHMLRHARAAHLRERGVPIDALARFLGHTNINTTMIYAHIGPEALRKEIPAP
ncbi:MAG: site-specific integrase [Thaumarchaeota archaeon]|nr:site-specific integrase [Candidatus Calditenuaceae archaeon]